MKSKQVIAVDRKYRLRDNQFWYSDCSFANLILGKVAISLRIAGLGIRTLRHSAPGRDGRPTYSYKLSSPEDRFWWKQHRSELVQIELLDATDESSNTGLETSVEVIKTDTDTQVKKNEQAKVRLAELTITPVIESVVCIGLDIAWFGGSANKSDSQYDCLASVLVQPETNNAELKINRIKLQDRDMQAEQLIKAVSILLEEYPSVEHVVFAIDAPLQAVKRDYLPIRQATLTSGAVERRACESYLNAQRKAIDAVAGKSDGWHPNIQPGAPLAPRVERLLEGLNEIGFFIWTPTGCNVERLAIECFPAESIWAMKRLGYCPDGLTAHQAKAYKAQDGNHLIAAQVRDLVKDALNPFAVAIGDNMRWSSIVNAASDWMIEDKTWQSQGFYKGGKLLDDVVDTMICLATALSYSNGNSHVWYDPEHPDDGHIFGPGYQQRANWTGTLVV